MYGVGIGGSNEVGPEARLYLGNGVDAEAIEAVAHESGDPAKQLVLDVWNRLVEVRQTCQLTELHLGLEALSGRGVVAAVVDN
jgi:hypothetical protein